MAYRQENIDQVHQDEDQVTDPGLVVVVGAGDQGDGNEVVGQHLPVVLAALLNVDDQDLLQPERPLRQEVGLGQAAQLPDGPVGEELLHVQVVGRGGVDVLAVALANGFRQKTRP